MKIAPFKLERYFEKYEFSVPHLLSCSDCEPLMLADLLGMANDESKKRWDTLWLGYTESKGHPLLRNEISKLYTNISNDEVIVITPEEGIFIAMNTLLNANDHVITTFPGYQSLYEIAVSNNCRLSKWLPDANMKFNVDDLIALVTKETKFIVINFPHNPTGETISKTDLEKIVAVARKFNIVLFSDEMYRFLEYNEKDRLPSVSDIYENGISLFGLSKTFSLPGLRIGWLTTQNKELFNAIANFKDYTTICSSSTSEILAIIALQNKEGIINRNLNIIKSNLKLFKEFVLRNKGLFIWKEPIAGPIAFPGLKIETPVADFCEKLANEMGVMLLPSDVYDIDNKAVRVGFGRKNFPEALSAFEKFLNTSQVT